MEGMHELIFHLKFEIEGKWLSEVNANALIQRFRERLNNFKLEKGSLKASVDVPKNIDFEGCSYQNDDLAVGYYRNINVHAVDGCRKGEVADRLNIVVKAQIAKALKAIEEKRYNAILRVTEIDYL